MKICGPAPKKPCIHTHPGSQECWSERSVVCVMVLCLVIEILFYIQWKYFCWDTQNILNKDIRIVISTSTKQPKCLTTFPCSTVFIWILSQLMIISPLLWQELVSCVWSSPGQAWETSTVQWGDLRPQHSDKIWDHCHWQLNVFLTDLRIEFYVQWTF